VGFTPNKNPSKGIYGINVSKNGGDNNTCVTSDMINRSIFVMMYDISHDHKDIYTKFSLQRTRQ